MTEHIIKEGDVLDGLRTLPDCCVQCTVTSPPYYNLRNYGVDGQIGLEETPEQFIQKMVEVFREVRRVTREDGVLWLNLGDSYASTNPRHNHNGEGSLTGSNLKNKELAAPNEFIPLPAGYKAKDLMGIPWRVAFALQADGWYFRSAIPWIKRNCMPESTTDRPTSAIEYIFLMAKSAKYFYDGEAVRMPIATATVKRASGKNNAENRKDGGEAVWQGGLTPEQQDKYYSNITTESTRNYRNSDPFFESWQGLYSESENPLAFIINPQARPELHFATFPDLLAETCIKAGTKIGDTVLDPFMGSGTVAVVARNLNRSSIGCELNPEYVKIIRKRLNADSQLDTGVVSYRFEKV